MKKGKKAESINVENMIKEKNYKYMKGVYRNE